MLTKFRSFFGKTILGRSIKVLAPRDRKRLIILLILQIVMGVVDLVGVAVIGVVGALAVSGVKSQQPGGKVQQVLEFLNLSNFSFQNQVAILGSIAAVVLIGRTLLSILFTKRTLYYLSRRTAIISGRLVSQVLEQSMLEIQKRTTQQTLYSVTQGVSLITIGVIGTTMALIADSSLLVFMAVGLLIVDPIMAIGTFFVFLMIGFSLYKFMHERARVLGSESANLNILSNEKILEVLTSYRESVVRNRRRYYAKKIAELRLDLAQTEAELAFMPNISKYVIEVTVVVGAIILSAAQFLLSDATHAVSILAVFLAAGTRIAPAVLRLQQGALHIRGSIGAAEPTLNLIAQLPSIEENDFPSNTIPLDYPNFIPRIELRNIYFTYPNKNEPAISNFSLAIENGESIAFVGPSGAGKTTLVDLLLGVLSPDEGEIRISGLAPLDAIQEWSGGLSYVPQDVMISNGTVRDNVSLGYPTEVATDTAIWAALNVAQLTDFVKTLPQGLDTPVGERGMKISGGQRQRLGIARALFTNPRLVVLDEATSSLDGQTEADISDAIQALKGRVTIVLIAHRLSTIRYVDQVVYLANGKMLAKGTFEEVRSEIPDFDNQAKLMGL
jgi:ABC-type multidrug transport system fused ATPase/permease subunit